MGEETEGNLLRQYPR